MTAKKTAHLTLDLSDVRKAGTVEAAIEAWAAGSDTTSSGTIGSSFSTSGPGSGWSKNHDASDFSRRAFKEGALHYLDSKNGTLRSATSPTGEVIEDEDGDRTDEEGNTVLRDIGGCDYVVGDWSDESVVRIECPDMDDAMEYPETVALMAQAVIDHHDYESSVEWKALIRAMKEAAEAVEDIDEDKLGD